MSKAARLLNTAQPAVSRAISDLEHVLGVPVLDRSSRGVEATKYGRSLLDCGAVVFNDLRQGVKAIDALADPSLGEVRLAGGEPQVAGLVPAIFSRVRGRFPGISIHFLQGVMVAQQMSALRERRVDLILGRLSETTGADFQQQELFQERTVVVAGIDSLWCRRRKLSFSELANEAWALPAPESQAGTIFAQAFRKSGFDYPSRNVAFGPIHLHVTLAASGQFLAILPGSLLRFGAHRLALKVLPVASPVPPWPVGITTLRNRTLPPAAQLFVECAREVVKVLAKTK